MALFPGWVTEILAVAGAAGSAVMVWREVFKRPGVVARYHSHSRSHEGSSYDLFVSNVGAYDAVIHNVNWVFRSGMPVLVDVALTMEPGQLVLKPGEIERISIKMSEINLDIPREAVSLQVHAANNVDMMMYIPIQVDPEAMRSTRPRAMTALQCRVARLIPWVTSY